MADLQLNPQEKLEVSYVIFIKVVMQILPNTYFQKNKINNMQQYLATSSINGGNTPNGGAYTGISVIPVSLNLGISVEEIDPLLLGVPIVSPATTAVTQAIGTSQNGISNN